MVSVCPFVCLCGQKLGSAWKILPVTARSLLGQFVFGTGRRRRLMAAAANWWRKRVWISNSSTKTSKLVEEEIFGLAAAAVPHVVAALRGGRPFVPSISGDHNRGQWRDSSSRRKQLLCTRCYFNEPGGMSSSLEAKKNQASAKKSNNSSTTHGGGRSLSNCFCVASNRYESEAAEEGRHLLSVFFFFLEFVH